MSLHLITGPMFSGKTSALMTRLSTFELGGQTTILFKYSKDTRYDRGSLVSSHDQDTWKAHPTQSLDVNDPRLLDKDVVGIDEGQFMENIVPFCQAMADAGKTVVVAALDTNFKREPFSSVAHLLAIAEQVEKRTAVCLVCSQSASFTRRLTTDTQEELIGGDDLYTALCRTCFHLKEIPPEALERRQHCLAKIRHLKE